MSKWWLPVRNHGMTCAHGHIHHISKNPFTACLSYLQWTSDFTTVLYNLEWYSPVLNATNNEVIGRDMNNLLSFANVSLIILFSNPFMSLVLQKSTISCLLPLGIWLGKYGLHQLNSLFTYIRFVSVWSVIM